MFDYKILFLNSTLLILQLYYEYNKGETVLILACRNGAVEIIKLIFDSGNVDANLTDNVLHLISIYF
jgi:ankyrin repeat protein